MTELSNVQQWYQGKDLLVTGGTGFMGKVLIEKLLRCCPGIGNIYMVVRPKRGIDPKQRLETISKLPVFERLLDENPKAFEKVEVLEGNLLEKHLGLSSANTEKLLSNVSVVFHLAASLRLEANIKEAVLANTLGTQRVLELCSKMKLLESFIHLSTAFCHSNLEVVGEELYEPHLDPYDIIKFIMENENAEEYLDKHRQKFLAHHPNAYTLSKSLAEWLMKDYESRMPIGVARPSIVIPAFKEPVSGWVDSLNGPVGVMVAAAKGVLRSLLCNEHYRAEVIPVDIAINALIFMGYVRSKVPQKETLVHNITVPKEILTISWGDILKRSRNLLGRFPFEWTLWYPDGSLTTNKYVHWTTIVLFQWIPAFLIDCLLFICRRRPFMMRLQRKIYTGINVLEHFTTNEWNFDVTKSLALMKKEHYGLDRNIFYLMDIDYDIEEYMVNCILGARKFCMKEDPKTLKYTRLHFKILFVLHILVKCVFWYWVINWCYGQLTAAINKW